MYAVDNFSSRLLKFTRNSEKQKTTALRSKRQGDKITLRNKGDCFIYDTLLKKIIDSMLVFLNPETKVERTNSICYKLNKLCSNTVDLDITRLTCFIRLIMNDFSTGKIKSEKIFSFFAHFT